jgi:hypothetical protein
LRVQAHPVLDKTDVSLAQEFRATLSGRVIDTQGAVVPSAKVTVTNQESQARTETVSGPDGFYNIPFLAPSAYTIFIEAAGFKRYVGRASGSAPMTA